MKVYEVSFGADGFKFLDEIHLTLKGANERIRELPDFLNNSISDISILKIAETNVYGDENKVYKFICECKDNTRKVVLWINEKELEP